MMKGRGYGCAGGRCCGRGRGPAVPPPPVEAVVGEVGEEVASAAQPTTSVGPLERGPRSLSAGAGSSSCCRHTCC